MVLFHKNAFGDVAGMLIDALAPDFSQPIDISIGFLYKSFLFGFDVIFEREGTVGTQLAAQVFVGCPCDELKRLIGGVLKTIIQIVVDNRSACAEWNLPVEIREQIHAVVMVVLHNRHRRVQDHPVNEVGELAHSAADPVAGTAI